MPCLKQEDDMSDISTPAAETIAAPENTSNSLMQKQRKKRKRARIRLICWILILAILGGGAGYGIYQLFFKKEPQLAVTDYTVFGSLDRSIKGSGTTTPLETLSITATSRATIEEVFVKAGDTVEVGQLLYTQDDSEVDTQITRYENQIASKENQIQGYEEDILAEEQKIIEYEISINEKQLELINLRKASATVTAPFSGKVSRVSLKVGDSVKADTTVAQLTDDSILTITQYYSYAYADKVRKGMPVDVNISSHSMTLTGTVTEINWVERVTDEGMKCFAVTLEIQNPGSLKEGVSGLCTLLADDGTRIYPSIESTFAYKSVTDIKTTYGGEVIAVNATNYDQVSAGDILFLFNSDGLDTALANKEKEIESLEKNIKSSENTIAAREQSITTAEEEIETIRTSITETEESRANYAKRSDIAGRVMYCNVEAGDRPNTNSSLLTIYNMETMTLSVNFDELDADYVQEGTKVTVTRTSAEKSTHYRGTITYLSPEATSSGGVSTFAATIEVDSKGDLASGVSVSYSIALGDSEEGVLAPVAALKSHDEQYYLYVKADKRPDNAVDFDDPNVEIPDGFFAVPVEVGSSNEQYVRILSGVKEDTEVFTRYRQMAPADGDKTLDTSGEETEVSEESPFPNMGGSQGSFPQGNFGQGSFPQSGSQQSGSQQGGFQRPSGSSGTMPGGNMSSSQQRPAANTGSRG